MSGRRTVIVVDDDTALLNVDLRNTTTNQNILVKYAKPLLIITGLILVLFVGIILIAVIAYTTNRRHHDFPTNGLNNTVIMISIDGFRADYLDRCISKSICKNLQSIVSNGVRSQGMKPVFVSKTFPNHYSIATGLYAESHGIVANE